VKLRQSQDLNWCVYWDAYESDQSASRLRTVERDPNAPKDDCTVTIHTIFNILRLDYVLATVKHCF
jgi:hypothetical protein